MISISSSEAEYISLSTCGKNVIHPRALFQEFLNKELISEKHLAQKTINIDSISSLFLAEKPKITKLNKIIKIDAYHIK